MPYLAIKTNIADSLNVIVQIAILGSIERGLSSAASKRRFVILLVW
jgi:hypothetical protein